tara:strand:+ start:1321 stop:1563 length:243 start_codon:yes stop_codon:yes gene_type:complete
MYECGKWLSEKEVSDLFTIDEKDLMTLREFGFLRPGIHWKSSLDPDQLPWSPKVIYCLVYCREVIEGWKKNKATDGKMAA